MAITKETVEDKIEVVGDYKTIQIRTAIIIKEDGNEISRSFNRTSVTPGTLDGSDNFVDANLSSYSTEVKGIANTVWTQSVKDLYKACLIANKV
tara:strand:- start:214 stop:495 length:282 start_codon:yes stop_codon:yes gene_type:complete